MFGGSGVSSRQLSTQYSAGTPGPVAVRLGMPARQRPLAGGETPLLLNGQQDIRPSGPVSDRSGRRAPGGVGTDLTDPSTWRRQYAFPAGGQPVIKAKQHFT
jgi:hypothetical protein